MEKDITTPDKIAPPVGPKAGRKEMEMKNNRIESLADIKELEAQGMNKSNALFHKLSLCVRKALSDEERLGCHLIDIYRHLGRCIDSNYTYYDTLMDVWSEYFLKEDRT